jgi:hypothetical protein
MGDVVVLVKRVGVGGGRWVGCDLLGIGRGCFDVERAM